MGKVPTRKDPTAGAVPAVFLLEQHGSSAQIEPLTVNNCGGRQGAKKRNTGRHSHLYRPTLGYVLLAVDVERILIVVLHHGRKSYVLGLAFHASPGKSLHGSTVHSMGRVGSKGQKASVTGYANWGRITDSCHSAFFFPATVAI